MSDRELASCPACGATPIGGVFLRHRIWCPAGRRRTLIQACAVAVVFVGVLLVMWATSNVDGWILGVLLLLIVLLAVQFAVSLIWDMRTGNRGSGVSEYPGASSGRRQPHGLAPIPLPVVSDVYGEVVSRVLDGPILAASFFRPRVDLPESGGYFGIGSGAIVSVLADALDWLSRVKTYRKERGEVVHHLPRYTYVALTPRSLYFVDVEQAPVHIKEVIGSWPRADLTAWLSHDESFWLDVQLPDGRIATLEAVDPGPESKAVIGLLIDGPHAGIHPAGNE